MGESPPVGRFLALGDRAYAFLREHGQCSEDDLFKHVFGGQGAAALRTMLLTPLADDPRLARGDDGSWMLRDPRRVQGLTTRVDLKVVAVALAATGANPARARIVQVVAAQVSGDQTTGRFSATVNPGRRVPRYVAERLSLELDVLDNQPPFESVLDQLLAFIEIDRRPILAQDAHLTWSFLEAEARRGGRTLPPPLLIDANELATRVLGLTAKPTLALVAARLGIGTVRIGRPDEEARVLGQVFGKLLAAPSGGPEVEALLAQGSRERSAALLRSTTAEHLAESPGVYVMRDRDRTPLYVGKARDLRRRVGAYIHRPIGTTRRLEGLVGAVEAVDPTTCATDLEALVLEHRHIQQLQPRFNTVRQQHLPRLWIRLAPTPEPSHGKHRRQPRRLELSIGPDRADGDFVGPFRNETLAEGWRRLTRRVFELDALRRAGTDAYEARLHLAWQFLQGDRECAEPYARAGSPGLARTVLESRIAESQLPADPRAACCAVVRRSGGEVEGLLVDRGVFTGYATLDDDNPTAFAGRLLEPAMPRTGPEDLPIVLRWLGAQRSPAAQLVWLDSDPSAAADAIEAAAVSLLADWSRESFAAEFEDSFDAFS